MKVTKTETPSKKTAVHPSGQLTPRQIVRLGHAVSADNMVPIAEGYLGISDETVKNLQYENRNDAEAFIREIIKFWRIQNSGPNEIQVGICVCFFKHISQFSSYFSCLLDPAVSELQSCNGKEGDKHRN